jgi:hypothetical protein
MDLRLFFGVIRRSKFLVIGGTLVGLFLAILAYGTPKLVGGKPTIVPHGQEVWEAQSSVLITYAGFPYGRTQSPTSSALASLASLSVVYANLAGSDQVTREIMAGEPSTAQVKAQPVYDPNSGLPEPIVSIAATAPTGTGARGLADRAASALQSYVAQKENASAVPSNQRIQLEILQKDATVTLVKGHKPTIPVLVFLALLTAVLTLAFIRDNARGGRQVNAPASPGDGLVAPQGYQFVAVPTNGHALSGESAFPSIGFLPVEPLTGRPEVTAAPAAAAGRDWAPDGWTEESLDDDLARDVDVAQQNRPTATMGSQGEMKSAVSVFRRLKRGGPA